MPKHECHLENFHGLFYDELARKIMLKDKISYSAVLKDISSKFIQTKLVNSFKLLLIKTKHLKLFIIESKTNIIIARNEVVQMNT